MLCPMCRARDMVEGRTYCRPCHAAYMREWRSRTPLTEEQRRKDICRSYANTYLRRGKLKREPCEVCQSMFSEMHHEDYSKPLQVRWLCRPCHRAHHVTVPRHPVAGQTTRQTTPQTL